MTTFIKAKAYGAGSANSGGVGRQVSILTRKRQAVGRGQCRIAAWRPAPDWKAAGDVDEAETSVVNTASLSSITWFPDQR